MSVRIDYGQWTQYQALAEPPVIPTPFGADLMAWQPEYPDFARGNEPLKDLTSWWSYAQLTDWGLDSGRSPWIPTYPDQPGRAQDPLRDYASWVFYVPAISRWGLDAIPWCPTYPNFPGRALLPVNVGPFAAYVPAVLDWGLDAIPWIPLYPEQPGRHAPSATEWLGWYTYGVDPTLFPINDVRWGPLYPDQPGRRIRSATEWSGFFAYIPALDRWGVDLGQPPWVFFPDYIWRQKSAEEWKGSYAFLPDLGSFPLPVPTPWLPAYPDFARGAPPVTYALRWNFWPERDFNVVPELSWEPEYPERARGPSPTLYAVPWLSILLDLADLPLPAPLVWQGAYPDFARGPAPLVPEGLYAYIPAVSRWGIDLGQPPWAIYPDQAPGALWIVALAQPSTSFVALVAAPAAAGGLIIAPFGPFPDAMHIWYPSPVKPRR